MNTVDKISTQLYSRYVSVSLNLKRLKIMCSIADSNSETVYMNGMLEQTIYDSSGRYRGFAHIPREMQIGARKVSNYFICLIFKQKTSKHLAC